MSISEKIRELEGLYSPSGEESLLRIFLRDVAVKADKVEEDNLGNLIIHKYAKKKGAAKTVMLTAHLDEVAMMVSHIDDSGFIRITNVGGLDASLMKGQRVTILHGREKVSGVVGSIPYHMSKDFSKKDMEFQDLWVDIGSTGMLNAEQKVSIGDYVLVEEGYQSLSDDVFCARGCDDKVGIAILWNILERMLSSRESLPFNLVFVFSAQEEVGLRGAQVASFSICPEVCIVVDVTHATDYPNINKNKYGKVNLGAGPVIPIGSNVSSAIQSQIIQVAQNRGISFQRLALPMSSGTDASVIQTSGCGCSTGLLSIPCRYMHSPAEVVSLSDIENCDKLLYEFIFTLKDKFKD